MIRVPRHPRHGALGAVPRRVRRFHQTEGELAVRQGLARQLLGGCNIAVARRVVHVSELRAPRGGIGHAGRNGPLAVVGEHHGHVFFIGGVGDGAVSPCRLLDLVIQRAGGHIGPVHLHVLLGEGQREGHRASHVACAGAGRPRHRRLGRGKGIVRHLLQGEAEHAVFQRAARQLLAGRQGGAALALVLVAEGLAAVYRVGNLQLARAVVRHRQGQGDFVAVVGHALMHLLALHRGRPRGRRLGDLIIVGIAIVTGVKLQGKARRRAGVGHLHLGPRAAGNGRPRGRALGVRGHQPEGKLALRQVAARQRLGQLYAVFALRAVFVGQGDFVHIGRHQPVFAVGHLGKPAARGLLLLRHAQRSVPVVRIDLDDRKPRLVVAVSRLGAVVFIQVIGLFAHVRRGIG